MDGLFANQVLAQMYLFDQGFANINDEDIKGITEGRSLPKKLDEEVAALMVAGFGGMTKLTPETRLY